MNKINDRYDQIETSLLRANIDIINSEKMDNLSKDLLYLRKLRKRQENITNKALMGLVCALTTGLITLFIIGIKEAIK